MPDNAEPPWLVRARSDLRKSTREVPGPEASPFILDLYRTLRITETSDEPAWCAVYACATLVRSGVKCWRKMRAARGALEWGDECQAKPGAICVLHRVDPKHPNEKHGHVGFYTHTSDDGRIWLISGNSHNQVSAASYDPARLLGYRWPKPSDIKVLS